MAKPDHWPFAQESKILASCPTWGVSGQGKNLIQLCMEIGELVTTVMVTLKLVKELFQLAIKTETMNLRHCPSGRKYPVGK